MAKIVIAQLNFMVGAIHKNAERIIKTIRKSRDKLKADLVIFPELALTGYPLEDLLLRPHIYTSINQAIEKIRRETKGINVILGYPEKRETKTFNSIIWLQNGKSITTYHKQKLPNYQVFDECRYFTAGTSSTVIEINGIKFGLLICEDSWYETPVKQAKEAGAQCMICINASPYSVDKLQQRQEIISHRISENSIPFIYVNLVGGQDELVFDGASFVMNEKAKVCALAPSFKEELLAFQLNNYGIPKPQSLPKTENSTQSTYNALILGIHDYVQKNRFPGVLIGLSGGIDSALTLCLAVDALGADHVSAVIMPSQYTAEMSIEDAITQCQWLGVQHHIIPIESIYHAYLDELNDIFCGLSNDVATKADRFSHKFTNRLTRKDEMRDKNERETGVYSNVNEDFEQVFNKADRFSRKSVTEENLQARIRGTFLMAFSNKTKNMVLTTGNKSEMAVGYATLYGDMAGGFCALKDIYKTEVYQLANYRNTLSKAIPKRVIERPPSAELAPNQKDQDTLPPYEILDKILQYYIDKDWDVDDIVAQNFSRQTVKKVVDMVVKNEYKRRQAPPGVRISEKAFGKDRRYPITCDY